MNIPLALTGLLMLAHDTLCHLSKRNILAPNFKVKIGRFRIHHGYVGLLLVTSSILL